MRVVFLEIFISLRPKSNALGLCSFRKEYTNGQGVCKMAKIIDNDIDSGFGRCYGCFIVAGLCALAALILVALFWN